MKIISIGISIIKSAIPIVIIILALQITGQLGNVISFGQSAMLKTGIFNAESEAQSDELFDFNFNAYSIDGVPINKDSLKGKVIFLNIWATWCAPCRAEMPTIQNLYNNLKNSNIAFVMLSIDRKDPALRVKQYIEKSGFTFPVYILQGLPNEQLNVASVPTTIIVSKKGRIISAESGMRNYDTERFKKFLLREANR